MDNQVYLKTQGEIHSGWTNVSITMVLNSLANAFQLSVKGGRKIYSGQEISLKIGNDLIMTGYVDSRSGKLSESTFAFTGRDKTQDLIDCSAPNSPGQWKNQKLEAIAADLCKPFGITVKNTANTGAPFTTFALDQGETPFDALSRLAKLRGVVLSSAPTGELLIFTPTQTPKPWALVQGVEIVDADYSDDASGRFSEYIVKGQASSSGGVDAKNSTASKGVAYDKGVIRYRPKIIISDEQSTATGVKARADYEATIHAAEAQNLTVKVNKWRDPEGKIWELGSLIPIRIPDLEIDMALLLTEINLSLDADAGYGAELKFTRPQSWSKEPLPEAKPEKKSKVKKPKKDKEGKETEKPTANNSLNKTTSKAAKK